jgi:hypothetical protein
MGFYGAFGVLWAYVTILIVVSIVLLGLGLILKWATR